MKRLDSSFFKCRSTSLAGDYIVKIKYCDWSPISDVCLAEYTKGGYFLWIVGSEDKLLESKKTIVKLLKKAKKEGLLVSDQLLKELYRADFSGIRMVRRKKVRESL